MEKRRWGEEGRRKGGGGGGREEGEGEGEEEGGGGGGEGGGGRGSEYRRAQQPPNGQCFASKLRASYQHNTFFPSHVLCVTRCINVGGARPIHATDSAQINYALTISLTVLHENTLLLLILSFHFSKMADQNIKQDTFNCCGTFEK